MPQWSGLLIIWIVNVFVFQMWFVLSLALNRISLFLLLGMWFLARQKWMMTCLFDLPLETWFMQWWIDALSCKRVVCLRFTTLLEWLACFILVLLLYSWTLWQAKTCKNQGSCFKLLSWWAKIKPPLNGRFKKWALVISWIQFEEWRASNYAET